MIILVISWLRAKEKVDWKIGLMNQELGFDVVMVCMANWKQLVED